MPILPLADFLAIRNPSFAPPGSPAATDWSPRQPHPDGRCFDRQHIREQETDFYPASCWFPEPRIRICMDVMENAFFRTSKWLTDTPRG
jgi:hypothetical protein